MKLRFILTFIVLSSCAPYKPSVWAKPDATTAGYNADTAACELEYTKSMAQPGLDGAFYAGNIYNLCMKSKGYHQEF